jgi:hypothetical protein
MFSLVGRNNSVKLDVLVELKSINFLLDDIGWIFYWFKDHLDGIKLESLIDEG